MIGYIFKDRMRMERKAFIKELLESNQALLAHIDASKSLTDTGSPRDISSLLRIALANEISVAELAAMWMPSVTDWEIKIALARQAGDEARHFQLVEQRMEELGFSMSDFKAPPLNPLFEFLRNLETPVEKIAAGLFTLESIAYRVNEHFMRFCEQLGDPKTVEIYQRFIQPDELHHHKLGQQLLEKYATTNEAQQKAKIAATKTLEIAQKLRAAAAQKIGTSCFPGC
jgi:uncharacterized ferritin-like protein (DUF455 family)